MRIGAIAISVTLAIVLLSTSVVCIPGTDADGNDYGNGEYGTTYDFNTQEIDDAIKTASGRSISEWVDYFSDQSEYYKYYLDKIDAISKFALTRETVQDGDMYTTDDHLSGYVKVKVDAGAHGPFPEAGRYDAKEGEEFGDFIKRIFIDNMSKTKSTVEMHVDMQVFIDIDYVTHADLSTGEITDSYLKFRVAMYDDERRNIDFHVETDDDFNPIYATLDYDSRDVDNNFFLDVEMGFTVEDTRVFTDTPEGNTWTVRPLVTEHVDKFVISSDLANSVWLQYLANSEKDANDSKLPKLILELIGSGGRMLDLFQTIKSLTSSDVPDLSVTGTFRAENVTDARGYKYCQLTLVNKGVDSTVFKIPKAGYTLNLSEIVMMIPDYVIDHDKKEDIADVLTALGWDDIDVGDISDNTPKKDECSMLYAYVDEKISEDDKESYPIPETYLIISYSGLGIAAVLIFLMWRRIL